MPGRLTGCPAGSQQLFELPAAASEVGLGLDIGVAGEAVEHKQRIGPRALDEFEQVADLRAVQREVLHQPDEPEPATAGWAPDGAACEACGETASRLWDDEGQQVCRSCKEW